MAKVREIYVCSSCQMRLSQWRGQCPGCHEWNTLEVLQVGSSSSALSLRKNFDQIVLLNSVEDNANQTISTGFESLDRVLGKGLVPGAAFLVGGEPGIGKSTLLLQLAGNVAALGLKVVYSSGEESLTQIKSRAARLDVLSENLFAISTSKVEEIIYSINSENPPALLIVDSVQTLSSSSAEGLPGNVSQVRAVATELIESCKKSGTSVILVGHVTKDGTLAGPRLLEHMVDTVIALEGDRQQVFRLLRVLKNRFGPNQELLVWQMGANGLELVIDPSTYFLGARDSKLSGAAVLMGVDGQRPLAVEVQALVTKSYLSIPRRTALGLDLNRLNLILAVLEKRLRLSFAEVDIYAKVGGGIKLLDPGMDLAIVGAILSSYYDIPLPERSVLWGEVDLNGQVRNVAAHSIRYEQAQRLGYSPIVCPKSKEASVGFGNLIEVQQSLFASKRSFKNLDVKN